MPAATSEEKDVTTNGGMRNDRAKIAATYELRAKILKLRIAGASYEEIARQFDLLDHNGNPSRAHVAMHIKRALAKATGEMNLAAADLVELECLRLDRASLALWPKVLAGDTKAADSWLRLRVSYRRLRDLDAPVRVTFTDDALDAEIRELTERLGAAGETGVTAPPPSHPG